MSVNNGDCHKLFAVNSCVDAVLSSATDRQAGSCRLLIGLIKTIPYLVRDCLYLHLFQPIWLPPWKIVYISSICIPGESHPRSRSGCTFPVRHIPIPSKDVGCRWGASNSWWGCAFLWAKSPLQVRRHWECTSLEGMGMCLTGKMCLTEKSHSLHRVVLEMLSDS